MIIRLRLRGYPLLDMLVELGSSWRARAEAGYFGVGVTYRHVVAEQYIEVATGFLESMASGKSAKAQAQPTMGRARRTK